MLRRFFIALPLFAQHNPDFERWIWRMEIERMRRDTPEQRRLEKQQADANDAATKQQETLRMLRDLDKALHALYASLLEPHEIDAKAMDVFRKQLKRAEQATK
jgi:hypothetical protein